MRGEKTTRQHVCAAVMLHRCGVCVCVCLRARASLPSFARLFFFSSFFPLNSGPAQSPQTFRLGCSLFFLRRRRKKKKKESLGFQAIQSPRCQEPLSSCGELRAEDKDYSQSIPPPSSLSSASASSSSPLSPPSLIQAPHPLTVCERGIKLFQHS